MELSQQNCHYCGSPPSGKLHLGRTKDGDIKYSIRRDSEGNKYKAVGWGSYLGDEAYFYYNGLDRLDSSLSHSKDNVVPCCKTCNWMKSSHSLEFFIEHIKRIYEWSLKQN